MRILSYNIQAAIASNSYLSYLSRLHRQILPVHAKQQTLCHIAKYISDFDIVCLQEIDLGGFRNGFESQVAQLLELTSFQYYLSQTNRVVGKLSRHGNLILSRFPLREVLNTTLPSRIKGRGILAAAIHDIDREMVIANVHLSLGISDQIKQFSFIQKNLESYKNVCLVGDFNCASSAAHLSILREHGYRHLLASSPTYPSWKPKKTLDHVFVKGDIKGHSYVEHFCASDHLPLVFETD